MPRPPTFEPVDPEGAGITSVAPEPRAPDRDDGPTLPMTAVQARLPPEMRLRRVVRHHPGRIVYAAWWEDRSVAVTVLPWPPHSDSEAVRIFTDQLDRVARLDHPHLAPVMRHGVTDLFGWYVHPHPECATLAERLRETGPMSLKDLTRLVAQVASALDYLHRHGVVHGCVHPDTILADDEGWVRLVDAALRQAFVPMAAETGQWDLLVPEPYLAPEHRLQRPSSVGPSIDQFALGTTVYAGLGCGDPFVRENGKRSRVPVTDRRDDLPDHVDAVLGRAMHAVPGGRYPSVLEFVAALDQQTHRAGAMGEPQSQLTSWARRLPMPEPPEPVELPEPGESRRRFGVAVGLVAMLLAGALWATWDTLGPPSTTETSVSQPRTERDGLVEAPRPLEADIPAEPGSEADAEGQPALSVAVKDRKSVV